jgi:excisionase family DNA binding protein
VSQPIANSDLVRDGLDRVSEAAKFLCVSVSTVYDMMSRGLLPFVKLGKSRRVPHLAVVELAAKNLVTPREK